MADTISLSTPDPLFDPDKPVKVNGYLYLPARRVLAGKPKVTVPTVRREKSLVEGRRKKVLERREI